MERKGGRVEREGEEGGGWEGRMEGGKSRGREEEEWGRK